MPATSIPDTLLELSAAPACQRKYQQAFTGQCRLLYWHTALQAPVLHTCQVTSDRPTPQLTATSPSVLLLQFITPGFLTFKRTLLLFSRLKSSKQTNKQNTSHKTLSRNNQTKTLEEKQENKKKPLKHPETLNTQGRSKSLLWQWWTLHSWWDH